MECDNNKVEIGVRMRYYINEIGHSNTLTASKYIREACELKNVLKSVKSPTGGGGSVREIKRSTIRGGREAGFSDFSF